MDKFERISKSYDLLDIEELKQKGLSRSSLTSRLAVTYPPLKSMAECSLGDIAKDAPLDSSLNLYFNCGFCSRRCTMCSFSHFDKFDHNLLEDYLQSLGREIEIKRPLYQDRQINSIYFGGGTPSLIPFDSLHRMITTIFMNFGLDDQKNDLEFNFEVHPEVVKRNDVFKMLCMIKRMGVNRINLGVQTFNDKTLKVLNRGHTAKESLQAYDVLRQVGFKNINIDLMYGLPHQTLESWYNDLSMAYQLDPESITTYFLETRKSSALYRWSQKNRAAMPDQKSIHLMHFLSLEYAKEHGRIHSPIDWFVKKDQTYRKKIWQRLNEYFGFGLGAYSFINGWQFYNHHDWQYYQGGDRIWKGRKLTDKNFMERAVILGLKSDSFNKEWFKDYFQVDIYQIFKKQINDLINNNLLEDKDGYLRLTNRGVLFADEIVSNFFIGNDIREDIGKYEKSKPKDYQKVDRFNYFSELQEINV